MKVTWSVPNMTDTEMEKSRSWNLQRILQTRLPKATWATILPGLPKDHLQVPDLPEHGDRPCSAEGLPGYTELILHSASEVHPPPSE